MSLSIRATRRSALTMGAALGSLAALPAPSTAQDAPFTLSTFAEGFDRPVFMTDPNDGSGRMFVVEQGGLIRIVRDGEVAESPFLDLSDQVTSGGERGLLGMALHPGFAENGVFFVDYTDLDGHTQVVRYQVGADTPDVADASSAEVILSVEQPAPNHNGGMLAFGADGYLYIGLGDGGGQGDPTNQAQDISTLLGSILRLNVDSQPIFGNYVIPGDNPLILESGARLEIFAYGFRNPWRFSFDRETGDLWIGDVGQNSFEEVDLIPAGTSGQNFGWNLAEGFECYADDACQEADIVWPVFTYGRDLGITVVGGYVYRGTAIPNLVGTYFCGDYGSGNIWMLTPGDEGEFLASEPVPTDLTISSFAEDAAGEVYVIDLSGAIYRIDPA